MAETILLIDDDPVLRAIVTAALTEYSVTGVGSAEEGMALFRSGHFDLVICDLVLPGIGGLEAMHSFRQERPDQRIMVVSAFGTKENLLASLREQVIDFIIKPISAEELQNAVRNLLARERSIAVISASQNGLSSVFQPGSRWPQAWATF